jgi:hypothetical protein
VTVFEEPVTVREEPVTVFEEPVTVREEPVTGFEEPVTVREEPATVFEEPVTVRPGDPDVGAVERDRADEGDPLAHPLPPARRARRLAIPSRTHEGHQEPRALGSGRRPAHAGGK